MKSFRNLLVLMIIGLVWPWVSAQAEGVDFKQKSQEYIEAVESFDTSRGFENQVEATNLLRALYKDLFARKLEIYDLGKAYKERQEIVNNLWLFRSSLTSRLKALSRRGVTIETHLLQAVRDVDRLVRYAEDILLELPYNHDLSKPKAAGRMFTAIDSRNQGQEILVHPSLDRSVVVDSQNGQVKLRSGDVVLVRGNAFTSAAIARIGDTDGQFSHAGIVHYEASEDKWYIVESLIETGVIRSPLEEAFDHGVARAVLFRHADSEIAAKASQHVHDRAKEAEVTGQPWEYEFAMRLGEVTPGVGPKEEDFQRTACTKLVRYAFAWASKGYVNLPTYGTTFTMQNRDFLDRIGVNETDVFAPSDLIYEPEFDVVAEWRDPRFTAEQRIKDLILMKIFEWMEIYGYEFAETFLVEQAGKLGYKAMQWAWSWPFAEGWEPQEVLNPGEAKTWLGRSWVGQAWRKSYQKTIGWVKGKIRSKIPYWMNEQMLELVIMLQTMGGSIFKPLYKAHEKALKEGSIAQHPRDILLALEELRTSQPKLFEKYLKKKSEWDPKEVVEPYHRELINQSMASPEACAENF